MTIYDMCTTRSLCSLFHCHAGDHDPWYTVAIGTLRRLPRARLQARPVYTAPPAAARHTYAPRLLRTPNLHKNYTLSSNKPVIVLESAVCCSA